jgi:hypothetical protein
LLFVAYAIAVAGVGIVLWNLKSRKLGSFESTLLLICAATMIFMTGLARPIWDLVPMLQALQFAWRFNCVIDIGLAGLIAAVTVELSSRLGERRLLIAAVGAFSAMAVMADVCAVRFGVFDFDPMLWSKRVAYSPGLWPVPPAHGTQSPPGRHAPAVERWRRARCRSCADRKGRLGGRRGPGASYPLAPA